MQQPSWKRCEVFPIIARLIGQEYQQHQRHITTHEVTLRLLQDSEARPIIEAAQQPQDDKQSLEWWAHNMVAWFSQHITVGQSEWQRTFERAKINSPWAYKPTQPTGNVVWVCAEELQRDLSTHLQRVEAGETLVIVQAGKPVAEVKPIVSQPETLRPFGLCAGEFTVPDDFDAPLPLDILEAFEGQGDACSTHLSSFGSSAEMPSCRMAGGTAFVTLSTASM